MSQIRYIPLERIGTGGMATVYRARQIGLHGFERIVALKRISAAHAADPAFVSWFIREARIACSLAHPGIVQIYDFGRDAEGYFIAMEHLEGESLQQFSGRSLPIAVIISIARQLCDALDHVHGRVGSDGRTLEIIHRDISLANLFVTRSGHLKLIDFGIASARDAAWAKSQVVGKLSYMAPEVMTGGAVDARADLFAAGVVLWQLLCGRQLFNGASDSETVRNVLHAEIPRVRRFRPDCPQELDDLVAAALERDPRRRPTSAAAMRDRLDATMRHWLVDATPRAIARWVGGADTGVLNIEPTLLPTQPPTPPPVARAIQIEPTLLPAAPPVARAITPNVAVQQASRSRGSLAIRLSVAGALIAAGTITVALERGPSAIAATPSAPVASAPVVTPIEAPQLAMLSAPLASPVVATPIETPQPAGRIDLAHERSLRVANLASAAPAVEPTHEHRLPSLALASSVPAIEPTVQTALARERRLSTLRNRASQRPQRPIVQLPQIERFVPAAPIAREPEPVAIAPIPEVSLPAAPRGGPVTVPPDRVRQIAGDLGVVNVRRIDLEGVSRRFSALMCVDTHGAVSSVRFLGRVPEWLQRELGPNLRAFRFTPYVIDGQPVAACFTRQLAIR